ncbi:hypothetical protein CcaverHIS641_0607570 [Cutaneotrichosporon cavernicola]|nr:hypothetical protein CcaverHIS641_0607570 [Cutaneotrichosporon cavernicola]
MDSSSLASASDSGRDELESVYRCAHCPKEYTRRDYLQRHELNHVLRRHIAGSCKLRQADELRVRSHSHVNADVRSKDSRKRTRRTSREDTLLAGPSSHHSSDSDGMDDGQMEMGPPTSPHDHRLGRRLDGLDVDGQSSSTFNMSLPPIMVTPDSMDAVDLPRVAPHEQAPVSGGSWNSHRPSDTYVESGRALSSFDSVLAVQRPSVDYLTHSDSGHSVDAGPGILVPTPPMPEVQMGFGDPTNANSMDHLFNWLFSMTNIENVSTRGPVVGLTGLEASHVETQWLSRDDQTADQLVPRHSRSTVLESLESTSQEDTRPSPTRAPHSGGPPFPSFPETWDEAGWRLPPPKDLIDEQARSDMRDLFDGPEREYFSTSAFSIAQMKLYLELYFLNFAPLYPIVHRPSLGYRRLPPDLLLTMLCIGTAFADDRAGFRIAMKIHKRLRNRVFDMAEAEPRAPPHTIMTILLINYFSRSYCSVKEHAVAQIFHSSSIVMARLAGSFLPTFAPHPSPVASNPLDHWLAWVAQEERKRVGWLAFMMDTENAALFRHYLIVHFFSVQIDWPCQEDVWDALDPFAWSTAQRVTVQPASFRATLHEIAARGTVPPNLSETHLWITLHGLVSVCWTLLWRDLGDLNMVRETKILRWKSLLCRAFESLRQHVSLPARSGEEIDRPIFWSGVPLAHLGCILLLTDTEAVRIYAGAGNIAGRPVLSGEWVNANTYVSQWARSEDGTYSCATAIELLTQLFKWSHEVRFQTAPSLVPWCIYIASLVIWAYSTSLDGPVAFDAPYIIRASPGADGLDEDIKIEPSLARRDALAYLSRMGVDAADLPHTRGKNRCDGILAYSAYLLGTLGRGIMDESRGVLLGVLAGGPSSL